MKLSAALTILLIPASAEASALRHRTLQAGTIDAIKSKGKLRCGLGSALGFTAFETDLCRAVAATVLGDSEKYEIVQTNSGDRFKDLASDKFDVLIRTTTHTLARDTNEVSESRWTDLSHHAQGSHSPQF